MMDMDVEVNIVNVDMVNGTVHNLVYRYLALERLAREEELLVEVEEEPEVEMEAEMEVEMEIDEQDMIIPLTQTWSWVPGDGVSVEALMQEDADARFNEGDQYRFSVQQLMEDDAAERFN